MQGRAPSSFAEIHRTPECRFDPATQKHEHANTGTYDAKYFWNSFHGYAYIYIYIILLYYIIILFYIILY